MDELSSASQHHVPASFSLFFSFFLPKSPSPAGKPLGPRSRSEKGAMSARRFRFLSPLGNLAPFPEPGVNPAGLILRGKKNQKKTKLCPLLATFAAPELKGAEEGALPAPNSSPASKQRAR